MVEQIISGGQTGADRAGLEAGRVLGLLTGGFIPKGCKTERGKDESLLGFGCVESVSADYDVRTQLNVKEADGTVIFAPIISGGSRLTINLCERYHKPYLINPTQAAFTIWVTYYHIRKLNVAGNRESKSPGISFTVKHFLIEALGHGETAVSS